MNWRVAKSLEILLADVNKYAPHRRKDSDGSIGDARHQAERTSDHNPYIVLNGIGIVRARDFTHAPETGFDAYAFAEMLRLNKDSRIRYIISNKKILISWRNLTKTFNGLEIITMTYIQNTKANTLQLTIPK